MEKDKETIYLRKEDIKAALENLREGTMLTLEMPDKKEPEERKEADGTAGRTI